MLGKRISILRKKANMSQAELAELLHISSSALGSYEQGRRRPSSETLVSLASIFDVTTDYLLTGFHTCNLAYSTESSHPTQVEQHINILLLARKLGTLSYNELLNLLLSLSSLDASSR